MKARTARWIKKQKQKDIKKGFKALLEIGYEPCKSKELMPSKYYPMVPPNGTDRKSSLGKVHKKYYSEILNKKINARSQMLSHQ